MEKNVLDNGSTYARVKRKDRKDLIQFFAIRPNHERDKDFLKGEIWRIFYATFGKT